MYSDKVKLGDAEFEEYLETLTDINKQNSIGNTLLHAAVIFGSVNKIEMILKQPKLDIDIRNKSGETAIFKACQIQGLRTQIIVIDMLLKAGANPYIPNDNGVLGSVLVSNVTIQSKLRKYEKKFENTKKLGRFAKLMRD